MALTVRIFLTVLMIYVGCDHCSHCRLEGKASLGKNSTKRILDETGQMSVRQLSDYEKAQSCGHYFVFKKDELRRQANDDNSTDDIDEDSHQDKILGGEFAYYGEFPWVANIIYDNSHICGGGIISEFWVITAAHCILNGIKGKYRVIVGDFSMVTKDIYEIIHQVETIVFHNQYSQKFYDYDVGLIKIKPDRYGKGIQFNRFVQPFCLATATENPYEFETMTVIGWGKAGLTNEGRPVILKKVELDVYRPDKCKKAFPNAFTDNMFCMGSDKHESTCAGDSGGPVLAHTIEGVILYGIDSFGLPCRDGFKAPVMMSVPKFRRWISTQIQQNSKGSQGIMPVRRNPF